MLQFDKKTLTNDLINLIEIEVNDCKEKWQNEVMNKLKNSFFKKGANVDGQIIKYEKKVVLDLKANAYVLADSFGTGSLMSTDNPFLEEYKRSEYWNPSRKNNKIHGRKRGTYKDIFGRERETSGIYDGVVLEGRKIRLKDGTDFNINPIAPSNALEDAYKALIVTYARNVYKNALSKINLSKYLVKK